MKLEPMGRDITDEDNRAVSAALDALVEHLEQERELHPDCSKLYVMMAITFDFTLFEQVAIREAAAKAFRLMADVIARGRDHVDETAGPICDALNEVMALCEADGLKREGKQQ